ncbi:hypothetical protein BD769DRAFT_1668198 [Suillus cothurnatus]|nr:hypothetical protein BD769DRAFT_1668198 [Suillus cothurnatus]
MPKTLSDTENLSSMFTSTASLPLDTPEAIERQLTLDEEELDSREASDHEAREDLREEDEESLPDAPEPNAILLPAFQWDTGVPLIIPRKLNPRSIPSAQSNIQPTVIPKQAQTIKATMTTTSASAPSLFHGRDDENSANFIWSLEGYIAINHITDEAIMIMLLGTFISVGSDTDIWWMGLGASHKATWASAKTEFLAKWPAIVVAGKTQREYQKELLEL